jgi:hypothetical protein
LTNGNEDDKKLNITGYDYHALSHLITMVKSVIKIMGIICEGNNGTVSLMMA